MSVTVPALNETRLSKINQAIQQLASGRSNAFGTVTLAVSPATSTTVTDRNCGTDTVPILMPTTANAAAAQATNIHSDGHNHKRRVCDPTQLFGCYGPQILYALHG